MRASIAATVGATTRWEARNVNTEKLLSEYAELEKKAKELKGELRCNHDCAGLCVTPEVWQAKEALIHVTMRMDEINELLGRDKRLAYHY